MALKGIELLHERRKKERELTLASLQEEDARVRRWSLVFGTEEGLLVLDELLDLCGVLDSIHDTSARIHYNSGRQDLGHEILATIMKADDGIFHRLIDKWVREMADRKAAMIRQAKGE